MQITMSDEREYTDSKTLAVFDQYLPKVFRYISCWVDLTAAAEDLTLSVLKKALAGFEGCLVDEDSVSVRVLGIAREEMRHYHNECTGNKVGNDEQVNERTEVPVNREARERLLGGLEKLTPLEKEVISLKLAAGLSDHCIARIMGTSDALVGARLCQALKKLNGNLA